jgi:hypothetical protein
MALAACTHGRPAPGTVSPSPASPQRSEAAQSVKLAPLPRAAVVQCRGEPHLRPACPTTAPVGIGGGGRVFRQGHHWTFTAEGGVSYGNPRRDRPPAFVHTVVQGDDLSDVFETFTYLRSLVVHPRGGLMLDRERLRLARLGLAGETPQALYLGRVTWNGRIGDLVLAPPFEYSDTIHADHLIFRWADHGYEYAMSLHAWEPFLEAVAALRAMVDSLPRR